ncbi:MAG TPA: NADPH-dependent FMN reductase [Gammaproteobacteria bacterium]|jgi:NAD(P)H-dependent FMN reductase|nr:NADPH-dependent FMN reductase [Gammaproteobacteria bacterium]
MTKIFAISGSVRRESTNSALLRAAREAAPQGVELLLHEGMGALPIFSPDHTDPLPPGPAALRQALAACDGLLISAPEYAHGVPGGLKNLLDWVVGWGELAETPVALWHASVYGEHAKASLGEILKTMSMRLVPEAALTLHLRGKKPPEMAPILADAGTRKTLHDTLTVFAGSIRARPRPLIS